MIENIWEGIYDSFDQCPSCGQGYESERWILQETERVNSLRQAAKNDKTIPSAVSYRTNLLPFLAVTTAVHSKENKVTIMDFGGGLGSTYISVTAACANKQVVEYHIVDSKSICQVGKTYFKGDNHIQFYDHLPEELQAVDIVCLSSSIQYIKDWKGLLGEISKYDPLHIFLADVPAGDIPTYATVQNYYESKIPYWFFNVNDIISEMSSIAFKVVFKSSCASTYLGKKQPIPQNNFPVEYRVGDSCNLLFSRTAT
jgi:putative methyltransferase (TIGR04325 family)